MRAAQVFDIGSLRALKKALIENDRRFHVPNVAQRPHNGRRLNTFRKPIVNIDKRAEVGQKADDP